MAVCFYTSTYSRVLVVAADWGLIPFHTGFVEFANERSSQGLALSVSHPRRTGASPRAQGKSNRGSRAGSIV